MNQNLTEEDSSRNQNTKCSSIRKNKSYIDDFMDTSKIIRHLGLKTPGLDNLAQDVTSEDVVFNSRLALLEEAKQYVKESNFNPKAIVDNILEMKFELKDKILFNAFCTWLWTTIGYE